MTKKPYIDLWSYVASIAPEKVAEAECFEQTWISTERVPEQSMALIPNQFIKYFKDKNEIQAKYNNGLMRFTRIDYWHKETVSEKLSKMEVEDRHVADLAYIINRSEDVIVIKKEFQLCSHLTEDRSNLELIAEELKQIGGVVSIDGLWHDDVLWDEDRRSGIYCPAPYNIPMVVDFRNEKLVLSPEFHLKAEKLLLKRIKSRSGNKEKKTKLSEWESLITELRTAFGKTSKMSEDRKFYLSLLKSNIQSAKTISDMKRLGVSIEEIVKNSYDGEMERLLKIQVKLNSDYVKRRLTSTKPWKAWEKRVLLAMYNVCRKWSECSGLRKSIRRAMAGKILEMFRIHLNSHTWLFLSKTFGTRVWDEYARMVKTFNAEFKWPTANATPQKSAP